MDTGRCGGARRVARRSAVAAVVLACAVVTAGCAAPKSAAPSAAPGGDVSNVTRGGTPEERAAADGFQDPSTPQDPVVAGTPVRIRIPSIGVDAPVQHLKQNHDGVLLPPDQWAAAGWFARGVKPGEIGPAVVAGHLDTTERAAVFVNLTKLRRGDGVDIRMSTGRVLHFTVDRSKIVKKALFPTNEVYGPTPDPQLRLITCNRPFDPDKGIYSDNLVVFATEH